ncbi:hypothetical protein ACFLTJ_03675 [Chloroflexota bacterium]
MELERKDGQRRHFRYDWQDVANHNPDYLAYVENERKRLGENHPLFLTQYRPLPIHSGGGFLDPQQRTQLGGVHPRQRQPQPGMVYVAGIDLAGEAEEDERRAANPRHASTVVTIGELDLSTTSEVMSQPLVRVTEHYWWTGKKHSELYPRLVDILKNVWHCRRVVVDATGIGQPISSFLRKALGSRVTPFTFTPQSKSQLGFKLLAAINSGRLKMYAADGSAEYQEFWLELERARSHYRPNQKMNFFVEPARGHDDFLMSLALLVEAANQYSPRSARGS